MAKKKQKKIQKPEVKPRGWQPSSWMIVAGIFFFISAGFAAKVMLSPVSAPVAGSANIQTSSGNITGLESQVRLVTANFRCACGGCGELPLIDCTCDMVKGAKEEKDFIRRKLRNGKTVDQVILLVEEKYGHRMI